MISLKCVELVKRFEGFSPTPYLCPAGYLTIGYGHIVREGENLKIPLSRQEAEFLLVTDLVKTAIAIRPLITVEVHQYMLDALVSFTFNVGVYAFRASTLRRLLNAKSFYEAADQFLRWVYAGGKRLKGLERRRIAERALFLEGVRELWK